MGRAMSKLTSPLRNFNVENRAARVLKKAEKVPAPAPKHESTREKLDLFREEHPEYLEAVTTKNDVLHDRLKQIYIDSKDDPIEIKSARLAPQLSREAKPDTDMGVMDVDYDIPEGKASLKTLLTVLAQHQKDPQTTSATHIAQTHKLELADVENVLKHFSALAIHLPEEMYKENKNLKKIVEQQMAEGGGLNINLKVLKNQSAQGKLDSGESPAPSKT